MDRDPEKFFEDLLEEETRRQKTSRNERVKRKRKAQKEERTCDDEELMNSLQLPELTTVTDTGGATSGCCGSEQFESIDESMGHEFEDLLEHLTPSNQRRPTFIEASRDKWDGIREDLSQSFLNGMQLKDVRLEERQQLLLGSICPECNEDSMEHNVFQKLIKVISFEGIAECNLGMSQCCQCGLYPMEKVSDFAAIGLWPIDAKGTCYFEFIFMNYNSTLMHFSPALSLGSILQSMMFLSSFREFVLCSNQPVLTTSQPSSLNTFYLKQDAFNYCMSEWRKQEYNYLKQFCNLFHCTACLSCPHAVHIDGNMKLYRYRAAARTTEPTDDVGTDLFVPGSIVDSEVLNLNYTIEQPAVIRSCGDTTWKAAQTRSQKYQKKDETGCMLATCRHSCILKALDMKRGEIYAYPYILQRQFAEGTHIALDTMCKYWPWLEHVNSELSQIHKPFLSVMHAKAHSWKCQVKWSGRVRAGTGLSTGETTEQANSYLSRLGHTTRHMTAEGRRERLTQGSAFWNLRKILEMPKYLAASLKKANAAISSLQSKVEQHCAELRISQCRLQEISQQLSSYSSDDPLEQSIEDLACNIQRLSNEILRSADSSKLRARLRDKRRQLKKKFADSIQQYCQLHEDISVECFDHCESTMMFPWTKTTSGLNLTPELLTAIDSCHLLQRTQEEITILQRERKNILTFWSQQPSSPNPHQRLMRDNMLSMCCLLLDQDSEVLEFERGLCSSNDSDDDEDVSSDEEESTSGLMD